MPTLTIEQAFRAALSHHQAGRTAQAEPIYRQILAAQPKHAQSWHMLGVLLLQSGKPDLAAQHISRALSFHPSDATAHSNLGEALRALGRLDAAIGAQRRSLALDPNNAHAHNNLGLALAAQGRWDEARASYERALARRSDFPEALNNLGLAMASLGRTDEAIRCYRRALARQPRNVEALNNLGLALGARREFEEAVSCYRKAIAVQPDLPDLWDNLALALADQARLDEAVAAYRHALAIRPDLPNVWNNLGFALSCQGNFEEAIECYERALHWRPNFVLAHTNLGHTLLMMDRYDEAQARYELALSLEPGDASQAMKLEFVPPQNNLSNLFKDCGRLDKAIAGYRKVLERAPGHAGVHSNLILVMHYRPGSDAEELRAELALWNQRHALPLREQIRPHSNDRDPARRLKIGYVSADLWEHPVGRFLLPLLRCRDRDRFEVYAYANERRDDQVTAQLRELSDCWLNTRHFSDEELAQRIHDDGIDILVDLAMHTAHNRLPTFARRPAPVQVAYLAYPGSTGLETIAYRLTDATIEPPGCDESWSSEQPYHLPEVWCCYEPSPCAPPVSELPALSLGHITFGCLNNFTKVSDEALKLWARVLGEVPQSRLLLRCPPSQTRARVRALFEEHGIAPERLEFAGRWPSEEEYWRAYNRIDIALDPFPYNGTTTTCEALWQGVPVLTWPGELPASRATLSLLRVIGRSAWAASSPDEFVRLARELALDPQRLAQHRATLRATMQASPLMDSPRFARDVEAAFRAMWQTWCAAPQ